MAQAKTSKKEPASKPIQTRRTRKSVAVSELTPEDAGKVIRAIVGGTPRISSPYNHTFSVEHPEQAADTAKPASIKKAASSKTKRAPKTIETRHDRAAKKIVGKVPTWGQYTRPRQSTLTPSTTPPTTLDDIKRQTPQFTKRDLIGAALVAGLSIGFLETIVWLACEMAKV